MKQGTKIKKWIYAASSLVILVFCQLPLLAEADYSNTEQISALQNRIAQFILDQFPPTTNTEIQVSVAELDPRFRLAPCQDPVIEDEYRPEQQNANNLTYAFTQPVNRESLAGRHIVNIKCTAASAWSIFIPVNIDVWKNLPVLQSSVKRGDNIRAQALAMQRINLARLQGHPIETIEEATGKMASRSLLAGNVLYVDQLTEPELVKKGDQVVLTLQTGNISVSATGTARQSGKQGDQISVDNLTSNRTVTGRIVDKNTVSLSL